MISLDEFTIHINKVQKHSILNNKLSDILMSEGGILDYGDDLVSSIISLLETIFRDKSEWIGYWLWELDFGSKYEEGTVTIDHENVPMESIEDLYNVLVDNYKRGR